MPPFNLDLPRVKNIVRSDLPAATAQRRRGGAWVKNVLKILAFEAALIFAAALVPIQAEEHPDYAKNRYYNLGNREGYHEFKKGQHKEHNHNFPSSDDHEAYDHGYQLGWRGEHSYRIDHPQSSWSRVRTLPSALQ